MSTLKSSRAPIRKGSSSIPGLFIPWIYPPQNPGCNRHHQDDITFIRLGMAPEVTNFHRPRASILGGLDPNSIPAESSNLKVFCFLTGRSIHPKKKPEPTPKNPSQTIKTPPEFGGSIVDSHPFFGWFSPGGNWGFSFGVGLTPGLAFMKNSFAALFLELEIRESLNGCGW